MAKKKKKKNHFFLDFIRILVTLAVIIVVGGVAFLYVKETLVQKAGKEIMEYTIKSQARDLGVDMEQVEKVLQSIDDSDKEILESIVENHLNPDTLEKGADLLKNRDENGLVQFVQQELSEQEVGKLVDLYNKYRGRLSEDDINQIADSIQNSQDSE